jgi:hypothetical protein
VTCIPLRSDFIASEERAFTPPRCEKHEAPDQQQYKGYEERKSASIHVCHCQ